MPKLTLDDWLDWIAKQHPSTMDLTLDRIKSVAQHLQLTTWQIPVITVAGTNGKGSCVALLQSILTAAGYRVGAYTSPHLFQFNERISVNAVPVTDCDLIIACQHISKACQLLGTTLTFFEYATLMALYCFKQVDLDVLVLEVGLGGRLDAVNIIDASVAIISTISLDHVEYLGDNTEAIAFEKAGIMRSHQSVICGDFNPPQAIYERAKALNAPLYCQGRHFSYTALSKHWTYQDNHLTYADLPLPPLALQNTATVLMALTCLQQSLPTSKAAVMKGLAAVALPGRCEHKIIAGIDHYIDVAHNQAAGLHFADHIQRQACTGRTFAIVGMLADKDIYQTLLPLIPLVDHWCLASLDGVTSRGANASILKKAAQQLAIKPIKVYDTPKQAYESACFLAKSADRILVLGSFYTVESVFSKPLSSY